jgi:hypothetical protein
VLGVSVDRPCDVHLIEAYERGMKEVPHCAVWDAVGHSERYGVVVMDCPQPGCCRSEDDIRAKCNLGYWEVMRMGESLWPMP